MVYFIAVWSSQTSLKLQSGLQKKGMAGRCPRFTFLWGGNEGRRERELTGDEGIAITKNMPDQNAHDMAFDKESVMLDSEHLLEKATGRVH